MFLKQFLETHIRDLLHTGHIRIHCLIQHRNHSIVHCQTCGTNITRNQSSTIRTLDFLLDDAFNTRVAVGVATGEDHGDFRVAIIVFKADATVH